MENYYEILENIIDNWCFFAWYNWLSHSKLCLWELRHVLQKLQLLLRKEILPYIDFLKIINLNLHENVIVLHIFRKFCEKKCDIFNCERPAPRHDTKTLYKFHLTFKNFNPKFDAFITNFDRIKSIVVLMQIIC